MKKSQYIWSGPRASNVKDSDYYLNRALYFYYNQYPNYNANYKAGIFNRRANIKPNSVLDKCPEIYYYVLYNT